MQARLIDISRPLMAETAVWPGDTRFNLETIMALSQGESVNLSTLILSAHTGTHADAPYHFAEDGLKMEEVGLRPYWGRAQVVTIEKESGGLRPHEFTEYDLTLASRLLVRTPAGRLPFTQFPEQIVYPSPELADYLGQLGILLYGTDAPSVDAIDSKELSGHHALLRNGIAILEGLNLTAVPDGIYELVAMPLKIVGGDGSPVRAVLREMGD